MSTPDSEVPHEVSAVHDCDKEGCFAPPDEPEQSPSWGAIKARRKAESGLDDH